MKKYLFITALLLFPIIALAEFYLVRVSVILDGFLIFRTVTLATILGLIYGIYLIYAGSLIFLKAYKSWKEKSPWKLKLLGAFVSLIVFVIFLNIILTLSAIIHPSTNLLYFLENATYAIFGIHLMPIVMLPVGLYSIYLAIKSLTIDRKVNNSYTFGITVLVVNALLILASYYYIFVFSKDAILGILG